MKDNQKGNCKSCKHFVQHYVKKESCFREVSYGHCIGRQTFRTIEPNKITDCRFWERGEEERDNKDRVIREILGDIDDKLKGIKDILTYSSE